MYFKPQLELFVALATALLVFAMGCSQADVSDDDTADDDSATDDDVADDDIADDDSAQGPFDDAATVFDGDGPVVADPEDVVVVTLPSGIVVDAAADQLVLALEPDINEDRLTVVMADIEDAGCSIVGALPRSRVLQIGTPPGTLLEPVIARFADLDGVLLAAPNLLLAEDRVVQPNTLHPAEPDVAVLRATPPVCKLDYSPDPFGFDDWIADVQAEDGWDHGTGDGDVLVATVDSGFDLTMDLIVDERLQRLTFDGQPVTADDNDNSAVSHGTYTTSFAAADGGDEIDDAVGVCWDCSVLSVDWQVNVGMFFGTNIAAGLETALDQGADVVNISAGPVLNASMPNTNVNLLTLRQAWRENITPSVDAARREGAIVVFSAGNDGDGEDANHGPGDVTYDPAVTVYNDNQLLQAGAAVSENAWLTNGLIVAATRAGTIFDGATAPDDRMAEFSRRGAVVNLAAPGQAVGVGDGTEHQGTSYSAPIVAGAAGLAWSENAGDAGLAAPEVRQILLDTANTTALTGVALGGGFLDLDRAMEVAESSATVPVYAPIELVLPQGFVAEEDIEFTFDGAVGLDVLFLIDTSGSFGDDIDTLQASATTIVDELSTLAANIHFGVASFADFPLDDFGDPDHGDEAFVLDQAITSNADDVYEAIDLLDQPLNFGADGEESQLEALYQVATGAGRDVGGDGDHDDLGDIEPTDVGWRQEAMKLVILATDAPFHDSDLEADYPGAGLTETLDALNTAGIVVIGLDSGDTEGELQHVVDMTGGELFELSNDSAEIAESVYDGVYLATLEVDVRVEVVNDPEGFITAIIPAVHEDVGVGQTVPFHIEFEGVLDEPVADLDFMDIRLWITGDGAILARVPVRVAVPEGA